MRRSRRRGQTQERSEERRARGSEESLARPEGPQKVGGLTADASRILNHVEKKAQLIGETDLRGSEGKRGMATCRKKRNNRARANKDEEADGNGGKSAANKEEESGGRVGLRGAPPSRRDDSGL
eukprot:765271-Hanusia_phi.AAC.2